MPQGASVQIPGVNKYDLSREVARAIFNVSWDTYVPFVQGVLCRSGDKLQSMGYPVGDLLPVKGQETGRPLPLPSAVPKTVPTARSHHRMPVIAVDVVGERCLVIACKCHHCGVTVCRPQPILSLLWHVPRYRQLRLQR